MSVVLNVVGTFYWNVLFGLHWLSNCVCCCWWTFFYFLLIIYWYNNLPFIVFYLINEIYIKSQKYEKELENFILSKTKGKKKKKCRLEWQGLALLLHLPPKHLKRALGNRAKSKRANRTMVYVDIASPPLLKFQNLSGCWPNHLSIIN